jgi:hypothetical protein
MSRSEPLPAIVISEKKSNLAGMFMRTGQTVGSMQDRLTSTKSCREE